MKLKINILETDQQINKLILEEISKRINVAIGKSLSKISEEFKSILKNSIQNQPEYFSLKSGQLKYEFGIADASAIDTIVSSISNSVSAQKIKPSVIGNGIKGGLKVLILNEKTVEGLIKTDLASVYNNGYYLPWLEWLLLRGNSPIVKRFEVKFGRYPTSRSGGAIMVSSTSNWSVPSVFAGTKSNNWLTRAIDNIDDSNVEKIIKNQIENNL
jgi:hypothetical protein